MIALLKRKAWCLLTVCSVIAIILSYFQNLPLALAQNAEGPEISINYFDLTQGRLAFVYKAAKRSEIRVIDFSTLTVKPIVQGQTRYNSPSWSPDGQKLTFDSEINSERQVYTVNADGSMLTRLTSTKANSRDPDWSPDGTQIVFSSDRLAQGLDLFVMNADGSNQRSLEIVKRKATAENAMPCWSPRGNEILYATNEDWPGWDIGIYDLGSNSNKLLTKGYRSFSRPSWHPSGGSFVFSYGSGADIDIWEFRKGANSLKPLITRPGKDLDVIWNEDGTKLFFVSELNPGKGDFQLFVWDSEKNATVQVAKGKGSMHHPSWTPLPVRPIEDSEKTDAKAKQIEKKKE